MTFNRGRGGCEQNNVKALHFSKLAFLNFNTGNADFKYSTYLTF